MSALFDAVGFYLDHVAVIGGVALLLLATVSVGVTAVRQVNRRGRVIGSAGITPGAMLPATGSNSLADPQALLRDLSRSRK
ncbi:MAG: hypothetical protein ACK59B_08280, partial [Alphaproteobacteria bacterium]